MTSQLTSNSLYEAVAAGDAKTVGLLINNKTDVNRKNAYLYLAVSKNHVSVAQVFIRHGADLNARSNDMHAPLHIASCFGYTNMVRLLLENGANPDLKTNYGATSLFLAVSERRYETIQLLIEYGADMNIAESINGDVPIQTFC